MLFILTNLPLTPSDSLTCPCDLCTFITCCGRPGAELQNPAASLLFKCILVFLCCDNKLVCWKKPYLREIPCLIPSKPPHYPPLLKFPLKLLMPWMKSDSAPLAWPSGGLWFPLMKLALMDLGKSQGLVNLKGLCGRIASDFHPPPKPQSTGPHVSLLQGKVHQIQMVSQRKAPGSCKWFLNLS